MQALYAYVLHAYPNRSVANRVLKRSVQAPYDMSLFNLLILTRVAYYVLVEEKIRKQKYLPTEEDIHFSSKFNNNIWLQQIVQCEVFREAIHQRKLDTIDTEELVRGLFKKLYDHPEYKLYTIVEGHQPDSDKAILVLLYNEIMQLHPLYDSLMEECFPTWADDAEFSCLITTECLNSLGNTDISVLIQQAIYTEEQEQFASELFSKTLDNDEYLQLIIAPHLENWEVDRVATVDMILLKMALTEILYFPSIPVKASINEYIEIAKKYSGPKSKDFINGVLDKVMHLLKKEGKIVKTGRGLVE